MKWGCRGWKTLVMLGMAFFLSESSLHHAVLAVPAPVKIKVKRRVVPLLPPSPQIWDKVPHESAQRVAQDTSAGTRPKSMQARFQVWWAFLAIPSVWAVGNDEAYQQKFQEFIEELNEFILGHPSLAERPGVTQALEELRNHPNPSDEATHRQLYAQLVRALYGDSQDSATKSFVQAAEAYAGKHGNEVKKYRALQKYWTQVSQGAEGEPEEEKKGPSATGLLQTKEKKADPAQTNGDQEDGEDEKNQNCLESGVPASPSLNGLTRLFSQNPVPSSQASGDARKARIQQGEEEVQALRNKIQQKQGQCTGQHEAARKKNQEHSEFQLCLDELQSLRQQLDEKLQAQRSFQRQVEKGQATAFEAALKQAILQQKASQEALQAASEELKKYETCVKQWDEQAKNAAAIRVATLEEPSREACDQKREVARQKKEQLEGAARKVEEEVAARRLALTQFREGQVRDKKAAEASWQDRWQEYERVQGAVSGLEKAVGEARLGVTGAENALKKLKEGIRSSLSPTEKERLSEEQERLQLQLDQALAREKELSKQLKERRQLLGKLYKEITPELEARSIGEAPPLATRPSRTDLQWTRFGREQAEWEAHWKDATAQHGMKSQQEARHQEELRLRAELGQLTKAIEQAKSSGDQETLREVTQKKVALEQQRDDLVQAQLLFEARKKVAEAREGSTGRALAQQALNRMRSQQEQGEDQAWKPVLVKRGKTLVDQTVLAGEAEARQQERVKSPSLEGATDAHKQFATIYEKYLQGTEGLVPALEDLLAYYRRERVQAEQAKDPQKVQAYQALERQVRLEIRERDAQALREAGGPAKAQPAAPSAGGRKVQVAWEGGFSVVKSDGITVDIQPTQTGFPRSVGNVGVYSFQAPTKPDGKPGREERWVVSQLNEGKFQVEQYQKSGPSFVALGVAVSDLSESDVRRAMAQGLLPRKPPAETTEATPSKKLTELITAAKEVKEAEKVAAASPEKEGELQALLSPERRKELLAVRTAEAARAQRWPGFAPGFFHPSLGEQELAFWKRENKRLEDESQEKKPENFMSQEAYAQYKARFEAGKDKRATELKAIEAKIKELEEQVTAKKKEDAKAFQEIAPDLRVFGSADRALRYWEGVRKSLEQEVKQPEQLPGETAQEYRQRQENLAQFQVNKNSRAAKIEQVKAKEKVLQQYIETDHQKQQAAVIRNINEFEGLFRYEAGKPPASPVLGQAPSVAARLRYYEQLAQRDAGLLEVERAKEPAKRDASNIRVLEQALQRWKQEQRALQQEQSGQDQQLKEHKEQKTQDMKDRLDGLTKGP